MIEIKNLTRHFKKGAGLFDVSFEIPQGSIVAFVGDNGAGKTTTIKAIFNELRLESGSVLLNGESIFGEQRLQDVAFFPDTNNVPMQMKLKDYVNYIGAANGMDLHDLKDISNEVYEILELEPYINKKIKSLSAGWKKRAIMASVLVRRPKYLILDEPTANLDVQSKQEFIDILKELSDLGVTIMITSHIIEELQEIANRLVLIVKGRIVYDLPFNNKTEKIMDIYDKFAHQKESGAIDYVGNIYSKKNRKE